MPTVLQSGSLNFLEPSGPVHACNGIALPFFTVPLVAFVSKCTTNNRILRHQWIHLVGLESRVPDRGGSSHLGNLSSRRKFLAGVHRTGLHTTERIFERQSAGVSGEGRALVAGVPHTGCVVLCERQLIRNSCGGTERVLPQGVDEIVSVEVLSAATINTVQCTNF